MSLDKYTGQNIPDKVDKITGIENIEEIIQRKFLILDIIDNDRLLILKNLSATLGFSETQEMLTLRSNMINLIAKGESIKHVKIEYEEIAIGIINNNNGEKFIRAQIALNILKASIYLEGGQQDYYKEDMQDVLTYAQGMGYHSLAKLIKSLF